MKKLPAVILLTVCAIFLGGILYLLLLDRFATGDVYPPYSSLRSDPLGTMIFFESLEALPKLEVGRDHKAVNQLPEGEKTTYLHLAGKSQDWQNIDGDLYRTIDKFLLDGGRLVITLRPEYAKPTKNDQKQPKADEKDKEKKKSEDQKARKSTFFDLQKQWGLKLSRKFIPEKDAFARNVSSLPFPAELKWNGDIYIENPTAEWTVIYQTANGAVLAERKRGAGTIVIATDSYLVSNEALVRDRAPELLAWLIGPADHVIFDEAHHGIVDAPGLAALAGRYRLHGGILALMVLAGLFIWKNGSSLAPPRNATAAGSDFIPGRSTSAGFVALLRRNISRSALLATCVEEWRRTFAQSTRYTAGEKAAVEEILREEIARPARERNLISAYQKICAALHRRPTQPH